MKIWLALGPFRRTVSMRQRALSVRTTYLSCTSSTSSRLSTPWASSSSSSLEISGLLTRSTKAVRTFMSSSSAITPQSPGLPKEPRSLFRCLWLSLAHPFLLLPSPGAGRETLQHPHPPKGLLVPSPSHRRWGDGEPAIQRLRQARWEGLPHRGSEVQIGRAHV